MPDDIVALFVDTPRLLGPLLEDGRVTTLVGPPGLELAAMTCAIACSYRSGRELVHGWEPKGLGDVTIAAHGLDQASTLLDLGTGSGQFALPAARQFGQVIAVDVSPAMLQLLSRRATEARLRNLRCVKAGFLSYEHTGPPVDGVYSRHALHQLPDFWLGD